MAIRLATAADASWVAALLAAAYPAPPRVEDILSELATPMSVTLGDPVQNIVCRLVHQLVPASHAYPFAGAEATQIVWLLPAQTGLFTDGTHPRLLAYGLQEMLTRFPATGPRPVWALLDATALAQYGGLFTGLTAALPSARRVKVTNGRVIHMARLSDAAQRTAALRT